MGQQLLTYLPNIDYGTTFSEWLDIQNGVDTGKRNQVDPQLRYRRDGRDFAAYTHVDVLYQSYFTAFLMLAGINAEPPGSFSSGGAPVNPGNPYAKSSHQGLERGVVPEVVCASPSATGSAWRNRAFDQDGTGRLHRREAQQRGPKLGGTATELRQVWIVCTSAGIS
jgi:hypothetical protein